MPWTCPNCNRVFSRNKQAHSCESFDLDPLFLKSAKGVRELYDILILKMKEFGPLDIRIGSFGISLRNLSTFLHIIPEKNHLTLSFVRDEALDDFPVYQYYQQTSRKWSNLVKVESPEEIDNQLIGWLKDAYILCST